MSRCVLFAVRTLAQRSATRRSASLFQKSAQTITKTPRNYFFSPRKFRARVRAIFKYPLFLKSVNLVRIAKLQFLLSFLVLTSYQAFILAFISVYAQRDLPLTIAERRNVSHLAFSSSAILGTSYLST